MQKNLQGKYWNAIKIVKKQMNRQKECNVSNNVIMIFIVRINRLENNIINIMILNIWKS